MNDIVRFILDCVDWALTFDQRFRTLSTDAEQNYALIKSGDWRCGYFCHGTSAYCTY